MDARLGQQSVSRADTALTGTPASVWPAGRVFPLARDLLVSARPKQWIKNSFVFAALIFASKLAQPALLLKTLAAFLIFTGLSGAIYLLNDVADREADRRHPRKAKRPIASGRVSAPLAVGTAVAAVLMAVSAGLLLDAQFGLLAAAYVILMGCYTFVLKHLVLIDVFAIAGGFVLRAAGGAAAIHVTISPWLYLCTILLSLFLGFGKRRQELLMLAEGAPSHRRNLEEYSPALLNDLINIIAGATILAYSLYTFFASTVPQDHVMMVTIPFVLYGIFRYMLLTHRTDIAGSPEEAVWKDLPLLLNLVLWAATCAVIFALHR